MNTELQDQDLDRTPEAPEPPNDDGSVLGRIRAQRERKAQEEAPMRDLDIPEYGEGLLVRYQYPEGGYQRVVKAAQREQTSKDRDARLNSAADLLIACCGSVLGRRADGTIVDLLTDAAIVDGELPEPPLTFDRRLAEAMQITVPPTVANVQRFVVRALFSPRGLSQGVWDGDLALIGQSNSMLLWLNKSDVSLDEDFAGE